MSDVNHVILSGRLTRDPELSQTPNKADVVNFGIAVNRKYKNGNGELKEEANYIDCVAFNNLAQRINQYFAKGRPILIDGRLKYDSWETSEGQKRSKVRVVLDSFNFISPPPPKDGGSESSDNVNMTNDDFDSLVD